MPPDVLLLTVSLSVLAGPTEAGHADDRRKLGASGNKLLILWIAVAGLLLEGLFYSTARLLTKNRSKAMQNAFA